MTKGPGINNRVAELKLQLKHPQEALLIHSGSQTRSSTAETELQLQMDEYRKTVDARLAALETDRGRSMLPSAVFAGLMCVGYVALGVRGASCEEVHAYALSCVVVSLVALLVCNYAAIM